MQLFNIYNANISAFICNFSSLFSEYLLITGFKTIMIDYGLNWKLITNWTSDQTMLLIAIWHSAPWTLFTFRARRHRVHGCQPRILYLPKLSAIV